MSQLNKHINKYLDFYLSLERPSYSVLINAKWGAGKTFFIRQYLTERFGEASDSYVYLSLNGLSSIQDVYDTLIASFLPVVNRKGLKITGSLLNSILKYSSVSSNLSLKDFISPIRKNKFYIIDDLERYQGEIKEVFGFLSSLLEQDGVKVVVLANQEELLKNEPAYAGVKEKIIGKTLALRPDFDNASKVFISELGDTIGGRVLRDKLYLIGNAYNKSGLGNLRILRQAIHEISGILAFFEDDVSEKSEAFDTFVSMFFCIYIEFSSGGVSERDILERKDYVTFVYSSRREDYFKSGFDVIADKYKGIDLRSNVFPNDALHYFIVHGLADADVVKKYIQESPHFTVQSSEPAWKVVWHWYDRSEEVFFNAIDELDQKFARREYQEVEEILHVFGVRLWLANSVFLEKSHEDVYAECVLYIEDFFEKLDVSNYFLDVDLRAFYNAETLLDGSLSAYGLGYLESGSASFVSLASILLDKLQQAVNKELIVRGELLLSLLRDDVWEFHNKVCSNVVSITPYAQIPILKYIPPNDFADQLAELEPQDMRLGFLAISTRLYDVKSGVKLEELAWVIEVKDRLVEVLPNYSMFKIEVLKAKMRNHIDRVLVSSLER